MRPVERGLRKSDVGVSRVETAAAARARFAGDPADRCAAANVFLHVYSFVVQPNPRYHRFLSESFSLPLSLSLLSSSEFFSAHSRNLGSLPPQWCSRLSAGGC
jgi:hypothetical protein